MQRKKIFAVLILSALYIIVGLPDRLAAEQDGLSKDNYVIYSSALGQTVTVETIIDELIDTDIIIFGEEHNDSVTHYLQFRLLETAYEKYGRKVTLSMEMFDRDVQVVLDEYLDNMISEKHFTKDARAWNNYKDYRDMVEFAKENKLDVIAANAPMRYTNMATMKGQESLQSLSDEAKTFIAPLPYDTATGAHYEKLMEVMRQVKMPMMKKDPMEKPKMPPAAMPSFNINQGQSLWNATMAYSIIEYLKANPEKKVFHIHGKFHSDEYFGVPEYIEKYDAAEKFLVITTLTDESFPAVDFKHYKNLADYIIVTDPSIPRTFSQ